MPSFDERMYDLIRDGCQKSAMAVVPRLSKLVGPGRVVDVGGGEGWWGREFSRFGHDVAILDETVEPGSIITAGGTQVTFARVDLNAPEPLYTGFRVALCLEVAEHLPPESAPAFIEWLCGLAPIIVFSAAIPGQGGHHHLNERWPDYWDSLFVDYDMMGVSEDLRWEFWNDDRVEPWYRQNLLVYARSPESIEALGLNDCGLPKSVVHPIIFNAYRER